MPRQPYLRRLSCLLAGVLACAGMAQADVVVVVGAHSPAGMLSQSQVADIFLGKSTLLTPVDQPESSPLREEFYSRVTGRSAAQIKAHWAKMAFTGRGMPPRELAGSTEVKKALGQNPGLIGYIEKTAVDGSVRPLLSP